MSGFLTFLNWTVRILAGLFVAFHLYAPVSYTHLRAHET